MFNCKVMFDALWPHRLQHARLPCPSLSSKVCSNSCPLSWWCHPTISSSVTLFSVCPQSFSASGSFPMSWPFTSGGQSIGTWTSASVFLMNIEDWIPLRLTGLISCSPGDSQESSPAPWFKSTFSLVLSFLYGPTLTSIHDHWKNHKSINSCLETISLPWQISWIYPRTEDLLNSSFPGGCIL